MNSCVVIVTLLLLTHLSFSTVFWCETFSSEYDNGLVAPCTQCNSNDECSDDRECWGSTWCTTNDLCGSSSFPLCNPNYVLPPSYPLAYGICEESCMYSNDNMCDDGGVDSQYTVCDIGTDCEDCGTRLPYPPPYPSFSLPLPPLLPPLLPPSPPPLQPPLLPPLLYPLLPPSPPPSQPIMNPPPPISIIENVGLKYIKEIGLPIVLALFGLIGSVLGRIAVKNFSKKKKHKHRKHHVSRNNQHIEENPVFDRSKSIIAAQVKIYIENQRKKRNVEVESDVESDVDSNSISGSNESSNEINISVE